MKIWILEAFYSFFFSLYWLVKYWRNSCSGEKAISYCSMKSTPFIPSSSLSLHSDSSFYCEDWETNALCDFYIPSFPIESCLFFSDLPESRLLYVGILHGEFNSLSYYYYSALYCSKVILISSICIFILSLNLSFKGLPKERRFIRSIMFIWSKVSEK